MKPLRLIARCFLWATLTAVVFLVSCQSRIIYYPRPYDGTALSEMQRQGGQRIEYNTSQGKQVAFYYPSRLTNTMSPERLWFVFGGNGSLALDYSGNAVTWDPRAAYIFVDYPGYGLCEGSPNPSRIEESVVALAAKLKSDWHWTDAELSARSGVFGHSIGCAAALIAADRLQINRAVLCAAFTTMTDMAQRTVGWPLCYLNRHRFDNVARLQSLTARNARVRIFHGTADEVIPVTMGRELAQKFPQSVKFTEVTDSHHNEIVNDANAEIATALRELTAPAAR